MFYISQNLDNAQKSLCQKLCVILVRPVKHSFMGIFRPWELLGLLERTSQSWMSIPWFISHPPWDFKLQANQYSPAGTVMQINNSLLFYDSPWFSKWDISKQQIAKAIASSLCTYLESSNTCSWALRFLECGLAYIWTSLSSIFFITSFSKLLLM